ncbi:MAG: hypothetical protein R3B72_13580 [Polyangiaceae bacterium]
MTRRYHGRGGFVTLLSASLLMGCGGSDTEAYTAPDRARGARQPLTARCDESDALRCWLPWPSMRFLEAADTATGVRVSLDEAELLVDDSVTSLERADGFSLVTPWLTSFPGALAAARDEEVWLIDVEHEGAAPVPVRVRHEPNDEGTLVIADPREPLLENTEYGVVVRDALDTEDGSALAADASTRIALGLDPPASQADADLFGYYAPIRATLTDAGIEPGTVLRLSSFVTRSRAGATELLDDMRAASLAATASPIQIDRVEIAPSSEIAMIVEGQLTDLPLFADEDGYHYQGSALSVLGSHAAPFRVVVPAGSGDYRVVIFGHGTGGSFHDTAFDRDVAQVGAAKCGIQIYGWNDTEVINTFLGFKTAFRGSHKSTAWLAQAVADGAAIQQALESALGDVLAAPEIGGQANPAAGRRPDMSAPIWAGGSLGGTIGSVYAVSSPEVTHAVLNVPGAAWAQFITASSMFDLVSQFGVSSYGSELDVQLVLAMAQLNFDYVDGAIWAGDSRRASTVFLLQESIGDPILPNVGQEMLAVALDAVFVAEPLVPIADLGTTSTAVETTAITQFHVPEEDELAIHGFADRDTPAGEAARSQIRHFLTSTWAGEAEIVVPEGCSGGSCDFTD